MTADQYNWVQSIYFISYIIFEVPCNLLLKKHMSDIVGSLLAYGISYMNGLSGMSAWRWVYLLEGLAAMLFGAVVFLALPDYPKSPRSRRWLTPREQEYLETRLSDNAPKTADPAFRKEEVVACLKDARTYTFMLAQFMTNFAEYGLSWMLPTVTTDLGFAGLPRNQLLNIPPAAGSVPGVVFAGWFLKRAYIPLPAFLILSGASMLVFFILLAVLKSNIGIYVAVTFGSTFYATWFIPFWAWRSATLKGATGAAFGLAFQNCIEQVEGVVAPQLFQSKFANNGYKTPIAVCAGATAGAFLASWWAWWLTRHVERDVMRIRRLRAKAERKGEVYADDDIDVSGNR
ncbi:major facilitator superfamily domain-containing protein [Phyllosticta citrichinensis]